MDHDRASFESFFRAATGLAADPHPYQVNLASEPVRSCLIHVPTGCGKTAAVVLAWTWLRRKILDAVPQCERREVRFRRSGIRLVSVTASEI